MIIIALFIMQGPGSRECLELEWINVATLEAAKVCMSLIVAVQVKIVVMIGMSCIVEVRILRAVMTG